MNILIPHRWLLEHLRTEASPKKIQEYLSLSGPSVERVAKIGNDWIYDIEITTNRVDSMSVRGIAREAAAILPQFDVPAQLTKDTLNFAKIKPAAKTLPLPKIRNKLKLSRRVVCVILSNLQRTATPKWMADRLQAVGINVHDSAIDITNYITHELGHPIHAFDYDKIMALGGEIIITKARKGEQFATLDGESYVTVGGEVVFKNPAGKIIDLPAIKGTANSSVDNTTKNILLWMESIDPAKIRFASMTHAIRTVAAQLSEKGVDPHLMEPTLVRGIKLYQQLCRAEIASEIYDSFPGRKISKSVAVDLLKIHSYLGIELPIPKIVSMLEKLEFAVKAIRNTLYVTPPTFRQEDITIPADIIEEIARTYGYHNLPSRVMPTPIPLSYPIDVNFTAENTMKHFLADIGWQEVYTYSMTSEQLAQQSGYTLGQHCKLANALTDDKVFLRRSLVPSLKEVVDTNSQLTTLSVFELANVYQPQPSELPKEILRLGLVSTKSYRAVKGDVEALLKKFYLPEISVIMSDADNTGILKVGSATIGQVSVVDKKYTTIEIDIAKLLPIIKTHPTYQPLPKTANVIEQLTFTLPPKTPIGPILTDIRKADSRVKTVRLEGIYQANYTVTIEYWDARNNLANEDVRPIRKAIVKLVEKTYRAKLVGEVQ